MTIPKMDKIILRMDKIILKDTFYSRRLYLSNSQEQFTIMDTFHIQLFYISNIILQKILIQYDHPKYILVKAFMFIQ